MEKVQPNSLNLMAAGVCGLRQGPRTKGRTQWQQQVSLGWQKIKLTHIGVHSLFIAHRKRGTLPGVITLCASQLLSASALIRNCFRYYSFAFYLHFIYQAAELLAD